jgi:hypothetical protein
MHIKQRQKDRDLLPGSGRTFLRSILAGKHDAAVRGREHERRIDRRRSFRIPEEQRNRDGQHQEHHGERRGADDSRHHGRHGRDGDKWKAG